MNDNAEQKTISTTELDEPIPDPTIEDQLVSAIELFHYSSRFRDQLFIIHAQTTEYLWRLLPDLRVLQASHIRVCLCLTLTPEFRDLLEQLNRRGYQFSVFSSTSLATVDSSPVAGTELRQASAGGTILVIDLLTSTADRFFPGSEEAQVCDWAIRLGARKVFFAGNENGLVINDRFVSFPTLSELKEAVNKNRAVSVGVTTLAQIIKLAEGTPADLVLLHARTGELFQEIFTHRGAGTLIARSYENVVRRARASDVRDIALVMQPFVRSGALLKLSEEEILAKIASFYVFTVNGQIVATARLRPFGDCSEIAKLATLPRYRGRGRSGRLVREIIRKATAQGRRAVFSLSTEEKMYTFFTKLGFKEVPRETLPVEWQEQYDFSRPSRAYWLELPAPPERPASK